MKISNLPNKFKGSTPSFGMIDGSLVSDGVSIEGKRYPQFENLVPRFINPIDHGHPYPNDVFPFAKQVCHINFGNYYTGYNADMISCGGSVLKPFVSTKGSTAGKTFNTFGSRETISDDGEFSFIMDSDSQAGYSAGTPGKIGGVDQYNIKFSKILFETENLIVGVAYDKAYRDLGLTYSNSNVVAFNKTTLEGNVCLHSNMLVEYLGEDVNGNHWINYIAGYAPRDYASFSTQRHYIAKFNESTLTFSFVWGFIFAFAPTTRKLTYSADFVHRELDENGKLISADFIRADEGGDPRIESNDISFIHSTFYTATGSVVDNQTLTLPVTHKMTSGEGSNLFLVGTLTGTQIKAVITKGDAELSNNLPVYLITGDIADKVISNVEVVAVDVDNYNVSNVLFDRDTNDVWLFSRTLLTSGSGDAKFVSFDQAFVDSFNIQSIYGFACENGIGLSTSASTKSIYAPESPKVNVKLSLDKDTYVSGDTATITINSSKNGTVVLEVKGAKFSNGTRSISVPLLNNTATTTCTVESNVIVTVSHFKE